MLTLTSCQAPNAHSTWRAIAGYLTARLGESVRFIEDIAWEERLAQLEAGDIDLGWVCGAYYVNMVARPEPTIELLAAPVMAGERYGGRPVYFSDVVVRADSPFAAFADLRGAAWAINEPGSHSGYGVVAWHLARLSETWDFFGSVSVSGAHQRSLELILQGEVDAAAIDSTVLETELRARPHLARQIRIIAALGPSPIPPVVVQRHLPPALRSQLRHLLATLHDDPAGRAILGEAHIARFMPVVDADYDPLRQMAALSRSA